MPTQSSHQRDRLPMPLWDMIHQSLAAGAPTMQPHHLGIGGCPIDEHQPGRVKHALFSHPASVARTVPEKPHRVSEALAL
jgi:hypothetical protein